MDEPEKQEANQQPEQPEQPAEPEPTPPVVPQQETVAVECGNPKCGGKFEFPIEPTTTGFSFTCTACGANNRWSRA